MNKKVKDVLVGFLIVFVSVVMLFIFMGLIPHNAQASEEALRNEADRLHSVLEAARTTYATDIVNHFQVNEKEICKGTDCQASKWLYLPAEFFREMAKRSMKTKPDMRIQLISLWPLEPRNAPQTPNEKQGLIYVRDNPGKAYYSNEIVDGKKFFTAIYADNAVTPSCVSCHNSSEKTPKNDFKLNDVMGGVVIRLPIK